MGEERDQRLERRAASIVSKLFVPQQCLHDPDVDGSINALRYRTSTFLILLGDAVENFQAAQSRSHALSLVLIADLCWQFIRVMGGMAGKDMEILREILPRDHEQSDQDTADGHFARQIKIVEDAVWIFELHSFIRHPRSIYQCPSGNIPLITRGNSLTSVVKSGILLTKPGRSAMVPTVSYWNIDICFRTDTQKNLWLLKEPVSDEPAARLIRGASGVRQVLLNVAARLTTLCPWVSK